MGAARSSGRLVKLPAIDRNPGSLGARTYIPTDLAPGAPLVVVLHGCTQTAERYDAGTGWSHLADRLGFALLFPEQRRANNANLCFNWFQPGDIARDGGEAESIAQMVEAMVDRHALDRQRVFATGLSAGGAMTAVMLATYPDLFAGGAIIGGLPYDCAHDVRSALDRMAGRGARGTAGNDIATNASGSTSARLPAVSIWHGTADPTVVVGNMDDLATQWCGVHGVGAGAPQVSHGHNWERQSWAVDGRTVVETWRISGMGHGVPIDPTGPGALGSAGPYMLAVGIDSTAEIARSWGLGAIPAGAAKPAPVHDRATRILVPEPAVASGAPCGAPPPVSGIQATIEQALRSAGLMR